jgi:lysophospholipase L1-like esterase
MPYHVQSHGADILVVQFGLNDCNHWATDRGLPRVSLPAFVANLREIIARAGRFGAFRVLLNNNHPTSRVAEIMPHTDITYETSNRQYNQAIRTLAADIGGRIRFQDIEASFQGLVQSGKHIEDYLLADGLHLSVTGHQTYFEIMHPIILASIEDLVALSNV